MTVPKVPKQKTAVAGATGSAVGIGASLAAILNAGIIPTPWFPYITAITGLIALVGQIRSIVRKKA